MRRLSIFVALILIAGNLFAQEVITAISPNSADPGTSGLLVTFTLPNTTPPTPPSGLLPDSATIGTISGTSLTHSSLDTVTALFNIPANEVEGLKDAVVTFTTPQGEVSFTKADGFTVGESSGNGLTNGMPSSGYNLFGLINSTNTYLMDNDENIVKTWTSSYTPGDSVYLLEDSTLMRTANTESTNFIAGGQGGRVEQYDWDGSMIWAFDYDTTNYRSHHDVEVLPNGNILMIAWEMKTEAESLAAGRDSSLLTDGKLWPDHIIEVTPTGSYGGTIVWEWHAWDHLVQDYSAVKDNYGVVTDHPELIDLNYVMSGPTSGGADWQHINAIDYNEELDQIMVSVRNFSEVWIIDHSTTTAEASGHTGGSSGKGGDLLYRWGNPIAYGAGASTNQQLFVQHDAHWIDDGLPGAGNILIFNNGAGRIDGDYSSVVEIVPPVAGDGSYTNGLPVAPIWIYTNSTPTNFYASHISGAQRLPNGNTLICEGTEGYAFEVNDEGGLVWDYNTGGETFRFERYPPDYVGFEGTELEIPDPPANSYPVVDTAQAACYDNTAEIADPAPGEGFYGQDALYDGYQPGYVINADGLTVYDTITGLTWQQTPDLNDDGVIDVDDKLTWTEMQAYPATLNATNFGGYSDWRLPSIKELYSLMDFRGTDPMNDDTSTMTPFIDTDYFGFAYGDTGAGERTIDSQFGSSNLYVSTTMNGDKTLFGVNFADGRIKGYPANDIAPFKEFLLICCRGNNDYGINNFVDNGDGTVTDHATGMMWQQGDSGTGLLWSNALTYAEGLELGGYRDWRLPNAKELQSILDYTRSPDTTGSAAIDAIFSCTVITNEEGVVDYPWYFNSTTHAQQYGGGENGSYFCFGRAMGYMNSSWMDVHGAGSQRSDSKEFDLTGYTYVTDGYYFTAAPQGDAARFYNYARCVRGVAAEPQTDTDGDGMTDAYEYNYSGNITGMVATNDNDSDGLLNGDEYIAGTIPTDIDSALRMTESTVSVSGLVLSWDSELGRVYTIQSSTNLLTDPFVTIVASGIVAQTPVNTYTNNITNTAAFYRVVVE